MVSARNKQKINKVVKGLTKASKTHAGQAKTLKGIIHIHFLLQNGLK